MLLNRLTGSVACDALGEYLVHFVPPLSVQWYSQTSTLTDNDNSNSKLRGMLRSVIIYSSRSREVHK